MKIQRNGETYKVDRIEHMVHKDNLGSILKLGVLSHNAVVSQDVLTNDISLDQVQSRRAMKTWTHAGTQYKLHDFANFYWNTRNPMMYYRKSQQDDILILVMRLNILKEQLCFFTDGNAASNSTKIYYGKKQLVNVPWEVVLASSWNDEDEEIKREKKRMICAELLVHKVADLKYLKFIVARTEAAASYARSQLNERGISDIPVFVKREYYF